MRSKSGSRRKLTHDFDLQSQQQDKEEEEEEQAQMEETQAVEAANPDREEDEDEEENEEEEEEAPKLEEGFYEVETIRRRRVYKGQVQYFVKWKGWPESANTWEPVENLQSCLDYIAAFEERLQKSSGKRKRKYGGSYSATGAKNRRGSSLGPGSENPKDQEPDSINREDWNEMGIVSVCVNGPSPIVVEEEKQKGDGGRICIQLNGGSPEEESGQPLQGAKKRKSGSVRRFMQDSMQSQDNQKRLGIEDADSTEDDNVQRQKIGESGNPPYIAKIIKPMSFSASVTNNVQQVSVTFKAMRSDGQEVFVDDKELKINNPLLLISYYEQHLRYTPDSSDANKMRSLDSLI